LSDLHIEFADFDIPEVDADVTVLAGDIHTRDRALPFARALSLRRPVVYVAGNHEFYGTAIPKLYEKIRCQAEDSAVHLLQNGAFILDNARFIGATLWTDYGLLGTGTRELGMVVGKTTMTDFKKIRTSPDYRKLSPAYLYTSFRQTIGYLEAMLATPHAGPTIVVTHHAPSMHSIELQYRNDPISASYASDLEDLILSHEIDLWIHGHTHNCVDYTIGKTRVVSNQRGYPGECPKNFDPGFVVTL
jgi:predicted phosphodiesterase